MISLFMRRPKPEPVQQAEPHDAGLRAAVELVETLYGPATIGQISAALHAAGFVEADYCRANPDLRLAFSSTERALLHFLASVKLERRKFPITPRAPGLAAINALPADDRTMIAGLLAALLDAATADLQLDDLPRLWPEIEASRRLGGRRFLILGDTQSVFYRRSTAQGQDWLLPLHLGCDGAAMDLNDPQARTGRAWATLERIFALEQAAETPILIQFGQFDLEWLYPWRRVRDGREDFDQAEFDAFAAESVAAYAAFLQALIPPPRRGRVTVLGIFPPLGVPSLADSQVPDRIARLTGLNDPLALKAAMARLHWPDLRHRTQLHAQYNALLEAAIGGAGFGFASDFEGLLSREATLDQRFTVRDPNGARRLDVRATETLLSNTIWRLLEPDRPVARIGFADLAEIPDAALLPRLDRPEVDQASLSADQRAWARDGVVIKKAFLPDAVLDPYIARRGAFRPGTAWNAVGWPDGNCYEGVPELRDVALHPPLMALLQELMGEPMLFHLALTGWLSTERDWHQDDYLNPPFINTWYCAVWIALDTVTPQSGPFEYVPGSHRWPLLRGEKVRGFLTDEERGRKAATTKLVEWPKYAERFLSPAIEAQIQASGLPVVPFFGHKGDVLVWHSRLMHRGSKRVEEWDTVDGKVYSRYPRKSLITHYSGINHRPDMIAREQDANGQSYAVFGTELTLE